MGVGLVNSGENSSGVNNIFSPTLAPSNLTRFPLHVDVNSESVDHEFTAFGGHITFETSVGAVVLEHVHLKVKRSASAKL